tara:strand:- start:299 stop:577 length:279 start_codon:yes stop_codon:yes gene_type:complete
MIEPYSGKFKMKGKQIRQKGKVKLSSYFKQIEDGKKVSVVRELGVKAAFPKRIMGKSGEVIGSRGKFKLVKIKDGNKTKTFIIHPVHLKLLK